MNDLLFDFDFNTIKHNRMALFKPEDAMALINKCYELNISVYGVDAFILDDPYIQPFMEHSINANEKLDDDEQRERFNRHLVKYLNGKFVFEVVYEGY